jgi:Lon protease-like protein
MFPLPGFFLFPRALVPLHIFEARYRQMIDDLLDGPGRLVMATIVEDHLREIDGSPPVYQTGGLGEIVQHRRLQDGRYMILLLGLDRVRIDEVDSDRSYRQVRYEVLEETPAAPEIERTLRASLREAIRERAPSKLQLPDDLDAARLADVLLQCLQIPSPRMQELFATLDPVLRAESALREHSDRADSEPR